MVKKQLIAKKYMHCDNKSLIVQCTGPTKLETHSCQCQIKLQGQQALGTVFSYK